MSPELILLLFATAILSMTAVPRKLHWAGFLAITFLLVVFQLIAAIQAVCPTILSSAFDAFLLSLLMFGLTAWLSDHAARKQDWAIINGDVSNEDILASDVSRT